MFMEENDEGSESYRKRIEELNKRGVKTGCLLSDWCVTCVHSLRLGADLQQGIGLQEGEKVFVPYCETGCNGIPEFYTVNGRRIISESYPLRYEKEVGVEVEF